MYLWSIRSITPKIFFVQVQIKGTSPRSVLLTCRESKCPHDEQAGVLVRLKATSLSLVGIRSCNAVYNVRGRTSMQILADSCAIGTGELLDDPQFAWCRHLYRICGSAKHR